MQHVTFTLAGARRGARVALPLALAGLADGLVFGIVARHTGLSLYEAVLMSAFVCAGASQYVALTLWGQAGALAPLLIATVIVNLRHILMGASLQRWFSGLTARQTYGSAFFLSDESWALTTHEVEQGGRDMAFMVGSGVVLAAFWVLGTGTGHLLSGAISDPRQWGLDFAFVAVFMALLVSLRRGKRDILPWLVAAVVAIVSYRWLPQPWYILAGALSGSIAGAWRDLRGKGRQVRGEHIGTVEHDVSSFID